jgi:hypothetical protein
MEALEVGQQCFGQQLFGPLTDMITHSRAFLKPLDGI